MSSVCSKHHSNLLSGWAIGLDLVHEVYLWGCLTMLTYCLALLSEYLPFSSILDDVIV